MLTPSGQSANKLEKVMLLALWANTLKEELRHQNRATSKKLIMAGLGKPTYPINANTVASYLRYWKRLEDATQKWHKNPEDNYEHLAIDYGDPRGDYEPRSIMASYMSSWYEAEIKPEHILFTIGGIGALRTIFETFNTHYEDIPGYRIITPFPYYSAYSNNLHKLHPIHVMSEAGYKLTASALEKSIKEAYQLAEEDQGYPKAVLICNPSNPLGNVIETNELYKIAEVLRNYPELHIIFDEAYIEMTFVQTESFLKVAPDLKERVIILRSATKALSAAGERMAILIVFEQRLMNEILNKNISYFIHAPRSAQIAYAETMRDFNKEEQKKLSKFYKKKVEYVQNRLQLMGAEMPDPEYKVEATFYVLGDFSDLFGLEMPGEARRVLQHIDVVKTGEDLAYYLLFKDALLLAPLSYFGLPMNSGIMRITCSGNKHDLKEMMDRLEDRLFEARSNIKHQLLESIKQELPKIKEIDNQLYIICHQKLEYVIHEEDSCLVLKDKNNTLSKMRSIIDNLLGLIE
ncbi:pyridoxal phosphate-dependent aminotransferase [Legionella saoudiensis]|uniref:pyridoxal phosphate-dependent aminotransferase n=1 Tax=Legionella saoudiensis TaxID=1750561 RepID=UPI000731B28C|nr:pyridoxal phosphate-dependent aminotransferase [Legionella saoudiensis]